MRVVLIVERNSVMKSMNTEEQYSLDDLPDFFKPLRYIFEDRSFSSMRIQLEDVLYSIYPREDEHDTHA